MTRLVLASTSAARAALLRRAAVDFEVIASGVDEAPLKARWRTEGAPPARIAAGLAEAKAQAVSARTRAWVIGADQTLELDGGLVDKAESAAAMRARLLELRGRAHRLHSAVHLTDGVESWSEISTATLHVRAFTESWLDAYMAGDGATAAATVGGYRFEAEGVQLFDRVEGDYFTILGLPLLSLLAALRRRGLVPA